MTGLLWHPSAKRAQIAHLHTGPLILSAPPRLVLHTTEGSTAAGALATFRKTGDIGHFLISPTELYQLLPLSEYATALEHPSGTPETNREHAIQIEQVGYARESGEWSKSYYRRIHELAVWIHHQTGIQLDWDGISFREPERMSRTQWAFFNGVCGHVHVPDQPAGHSDPGRGYHVGYVCNGVN